MVKKGTKEYEDWCEVYEYMKKDILGYDETMKLPKYVVLRLIGLSEGKFMANKKQESFGEYPFSTILITMKMSKASINSYIHNNKSKFKNEQHKVNGVMKIIESKINDVVLRLRGVEKSEEKIEQSDLSHYEHKSATYKSKSKDKNNDKLEDLW